MDLVADTRFIEKFAQLSYKKGTRIYSQYEKTFGGPYCKYFFLACSFDVKDSSFLFEFFMSV